MTTETETTINQYNNPPAFPVVTGLTVQTCGMSLRDWFAGMALQGLLPIPPMPTTLEAIAFNCYATADAMLTERAKGDEAQ
jgi:hypothetical protein